LLGGASIGQRRPQRLGSWSLPTTRNRPKSQTRRSFSEAVQEFFQRLAELRMIRPGHASGDVAASASKMEELAAMFDEALRTLRLSLQVKDVCARRLLTKWKRTLDNGPTRAVIAACSGSAKTLQSSMGG
jgi:hypothetical protein